MVKPKVNTVMAYQLDFISYCELSPTDFIKKAMEFILHLKKNHVILSSFDYSLLALKSRRQVPKARKN